MAWSPRPTSPPYPRPPPTFARAVRSANLASSTSGPVSTAASGRGVQTVDGVHRRTGQHVRAVNEAPTPDGCDHLRTACRHITRLGRQVGHHARQAVLAVADSQCGWSGHGSGRDSHAVQRPLCVLAPAALIDAPMTWQSSDAHRVHAEFTNSPHTMKAELAFNDEHELVDLVTDDRSRASADGHHSTQQRWTTPLSAYRGHRSEARRDLRRRSLARPRPRGRVQLPRIQRRRTHLQHCTRKHIDKQKYPKITPARPVADAQTGLARLRATLGRMIGAVPQWQDNRGAPGSACSDALARAIVVATGEGNQPAREDTAPCVGGGDNSESHAVVDGHFPWFCANSLVLRVGS